MISAEKAIARANPVAFMEKRGFDLSGLQESLRDGYARWWCFGIPAGSFLQAVIEGDLYRAFSSADDQNLERLDYLLVWFWKNADARCIRKNAKAWGDAGGYFGRMEEAEGERQTNGL